ncbi:hypothetical protein Tco_1468084 [Tanacetum coccineum]
MAQQPMRIKEELCPRDKRVAVSASNLRINPDEIHAEPLFNITVYILKQHTLYNSLTLTTDAPEIYMQQFWHTEVKAPKKKKVEVPRRHRTIPDADNLLEDPDQAVDLVMSVDEAYNNQLKFKLKAVKQVSAYAQLLLDLKQGQKASREAQILKQIPKGPREGSNAVPNSPDHSDSFDSSIWETSDDEKTKSDNDSDNADNDDTAQTDQFVLIHRKEQLEPEP